MAILTHDVGLRGKAVTDIRNVAKINSGISNDPDREVVKLGNRFRTGVEANVVLERTHFCGTRGRNQVFLLYRIENILRRQSFGLHQPFVQIDHHLPLFTAV